jgi:hypothetical protein
VISGNGSCPLTGFYLASQQLQNLTEGQVRVSNAGVGIAVTPSDDQVSMGILGALGEFVNKSCFTAAGLTSDEYHPTLVG